MNKAQLVEVLATHFDGDKIEAARALDAVVQTITYSTAQGERVTITGFGTFEKVLRPARMVRDPRTGERRRVKASAVPQFRAGAELKEYVAGVRKVPRSARRKVAAKVAAQPSADQPGQADQGVIDGVWADPSRPTRSRAVARTHPREDLR